MVAGVLDRDWPFDDETITRERGEREPRAATGAASTGAECSEHRSAVARRGSAGG